MKYRMWKFAISKCIAWEGTKYDAAFKDFVYEDKGTIQPHYLINLVTTLISLFFYSKYRFHFFFSFFLDPDIQVRCSIPGSIYLITSVALVLITNFFQKPT